MLGWSGKMAVVTRTATVYEADVVRAVLGSEGIDAHVLGERINALFPSAALSLNPMGGVRILVPLEQLGAAREILHRSRHVHVPLPDDECEGEYEDALDPQDPAPPAPPADAFARRACWTALAATLLWPLAALTLYYLTQAVRLARRDGVQDPAAFRRQLLLAWVAGVVGPAVAAALLWRFVL